MNQDQDSLYEGCRKAAFVVTKDGQPLDVTPSQAVANYSVGLSWGYVGQGPLQTSLALLLDACGREDALAACREYLADVVAHLPQSKPWTLRASDIRSWVARRKARQASGMGVAAGLAV